MWKKADKANKGKKRRYEGSTGNLFKLPFKIFKKVFSIFFIWIIFIMIFGNLGTIVSVMADLSRNISFKQSVANNLKLGSLYTSSITLCASYVFVILSEILFNNINKKATKVLTYKLVLTTASIAIVVFMAIHYLLLLTPIQSSQDVNTKPNINSTIDDYSNVGNNIINKEKKEVDNNREVNQNKGDGNGIEIDVRQIVYFFASTVISLYLFSLSLLDQAEEIYDTDFKKGDETNPFYNQDNEDRNDLKDKVGVNGHPLNEEQEEESTVDEDEDLGDTQSSDKDAGYKRKTE